MRRICGMLFMLICIASSPAFAQRSTLFPEFVSGVVPDGVWISEMSFTNQGILGVSGIKIEFYDFTGAPLFIDSNLGGNTSYTFDLHPGGTQIIKVSSGGPLVEGYAVMTYPSNGSPVRATVFYRMEDDKGNVVADFAAPQQEFGSHYSLPVEMNSDPSQHVYTAVAVANPEIFSSSLQVMIFDLIGTDGEIDATARIWMRPGEQFADYLNEATLFEAFFSSLGDSYSYAGSLSVSSPFGVGVLGVRQIKNAFGAISADRGPVLGPFALSGPVIEEQEPNDSDIQAQIIADDASVITGLIGAQNDMDYFKFTGYHGDSISVLCYAQMNGSWLDSVLELRNENGELIAVDDQNGLSPELYPVKDSFIHVVLPADDTYYIRLTDRFGNGGPEYQYALHVKYVATWDY